jgi:hypothetical protein
VDTEKDATIGKRLPVVRLVAGAIVAFGSLVLLAGWIEDWAHVSLGSAEPADSRLYVASDPLWARALVFAAAAALASLLGSLIAGREMGKAVLIGLATWLLLLEDEALGEWQARLLYAGIIVCVISLTLLAAPRMRRWPASPSSG